MNNKVEDIRNKFKVVRDLLVSLAAGVVVVMAFCVVSSKPNTNPKWEDHNDGRFMIKHTDKTGNITYSEAKGYNLVVDTATGVNYICYNDGGCSPLYSMTGDVLIHFKDTDWNRRD
jgi:hypothetical protein